MSRIPTPASIDAAPAEAKPLLEAVVQQLGSAPNLFRIAATSPAGLEGLLGLNGALGKGALDPRTRERIALVVAEINGCDYCLAAHNYLGANVADLSPSEIIANRQGGSEDPKAAAAVAFAAAVTRQRGKVSEQEFAKVRAAGYSDAEVVEIICHVALNTLTNYINEVLETDIDFPLAEELPTA